MRGARGGTRAHRRCRSTSAEPGASQPCCCHLPRRAEAFRLKKACSQLVAAVTTKPIIWQPAAPQLLTPQLLTPQKAARWRAEGSSARGNPWASHPSPAAGAHWFGDPAQTYCLLNTAPWGGHLEFTPTITEPRAIPARSECWEVISQKRLGPVWELLNAQGKNTGTVLCESSKLQ